jgi:surface protein
MLSAALMEDISSYISNLKNVEAIQFTDQPAPKGTSVADVSEAGDGGVVCWNDGNSYYFSTQRPGVKVTAPKNCYMLFGGHPCIKTVDASMLDTSSSITMERMFYKCDELECIRGLEAWDVSRVQNMRWMFAGCHALQDISGLAGWNVSNVLDMNLMFSCCFALKNVDALAGWDVRRAADMGAMFWNCTSIRNADALAGWNVSGAENIYSIFAFCDSLHSVPGWASDT